MNYAVGIRGFYHGLVMGIVIIWEVVGLKAPNLIVPKLDMTAVTVIMNGMGLIHQVYVYIKLSSISYYYIYQSCKTYIYYFF